MPFLAIHEFETLLFSDTKTLAEKLKVKQTTIDTEIACFNSPEEINNSRETAPSKRLVTWSKGRYHKITTVISIANAIGIPKMRERCKLFDDWLTKLERLAN